ncbi:MAG TPA: hypothetical protein VF522_19565 [Ramlibacter sp.]|uniref:hypothetical protein n=1 Tax=Ramlibacter sp. TaxID=1917967 RepID=UPI002ED2ADAA
MKNTFRFHAAAALALLPLAAAVLPASVAAQHRDPVARVATVAATPAIERFTVRPDGKLLPGRQLRFQLVGLAGARASLDIPGVVRNVALRETRPGVYEGRYTIRRRDDLQAFDRAVATLRRGPERFTAQVAFAERGDRSAPRISQVTPGNGARVGERGRTFIQARLSDDRSGVDPRSVRLIVDGLDVTADARIRDDEIGYRERLGRGLHHAELVVRDRAGNEARSAWTFAVV